MLSHLPSRDRKEALLDPKAAIMNRHAGNRPISVLPGAFRHALCTESGARATHHRQPGPGGRRGDSSGHLVTNLGAGDFEVLEDGRPQKITACSYVNIADVASNRANLPTHSREPVNSEPPAIHLKQEQVRRTVVLLVDDLGLSFQSIGRVRLALRKFVDQQMQPGDLVAVIRTRGGMGALEQLPPTSASCTRLSIMCNGLFPAGALRRLSRSDTITVPMLLR